MNTLTKVGITFCLAGALGYAENFNGKLMDANCYEKSSQTGAQTSTSDRKAREKMAETCGATATSTGFVFQAHDGKVYKLDTAGNAKAASAMQSGALKSDKDGDVHASVSGTLEGDTVKVDSITGHK
jgi:hypothetical protein